MYICIYIYIDTYIYFSDFHGVFHATLSEDGCLLPMKLPRSLTFLAPDVAPFQADQTLLDLRRGLPWCHATAVAVMSGTTLGHPDLLVVDMKMNFRPLNISPQLKKTDLKMNEMMK